ncbi:type II secretion system protein GspD, partial [Providencia rettgeri]|nr:type II secretion system protein GspD [Providencia rettgeri]
MSRWLGVLIFLALPAVAKNVDFKLEAVPLPKAISLIYDEVLQKPYMLDPNLANDTSLISFHATEKQDFNQFIIRYFQ